MQRQDVGRREVLAMRARAREHLERMISAFAAYGPKGKHFKGSHASQKGQQWREALEALADKELRGEETLLQALGGSPMGFTRRFEKMASIVAVAYRIMERLAKDEPASDGDLDFLTEAITRSGPPFRCRASEDSRPPYRRGSDELDFVDDLLAYMNLCVQYGREHGICQFEGCGSLMIAGRGGKKFCSSECREAYWSYGRKKEYFLTKRQASRNRPQPPRKLKPSTSKKKGKADGRKRQTKRR